jgi:protein SCO1/2
VEASAGKIGTPIDHVLLFCYQYDPTAATYSASILKIIRLGGVLTIVCIVGGIFFFRRRDARSSVQAKLRQPLHSLPERGAH